MADKWQKMQDDWGSWADSVFGDRTNNTKGISAHLKEEVEELHHNPKDRLEYADCFALLMDKARNEGISMNDILLALHEKLQINKNRKWGAFNEEGISKHIE